MNKLSLTIMLVLTLVLTACGAQAGTIGVTASETLPAATVLILGTFKLEGTGNAVTAVQAVELLPLWQVYQSLSSSDTAAQAEIDALVEQIRETMTASQVKSIDGMNLTQSDVRAVMVEQNIVEAAPQQSGTISVSVSGGASQGGPVGGGMPPADLGGGDPALMGGAAPVTTSSGDTASATTQPSSSAGVPSVLLDALIQLLQSKAA